jgi:hypothetical protein
MASALVHLQFERVCALAERATSARGLGYRGAMDCGDTAEKLRDVVEALRDNAADYCRGRSPWARGGLAVYLAYAGVRHLADPLYRSWFAGITLAFHELGHIVFAPFGRTLMLLGGSILQLFIPFVAGAYLLLRQRDWFGLLVGQSWLAFSTWELATYIDDANKERLPLVSMGGAAEHDWSALLTQWHLLNSCETIATATRGAAFLLWATAMAATTWLLWRMAHPEPK